MRICTHVRREWHRTAHGWLIELECGSFEHRPFDGEGIAVRVLGQAHITAADVEWLRNVVPQPQR